MNALNYKRYFAEHGLQLSRQAGTNCAYWMLARTAPDAFRQRFPSLRAARDWWHLVICRADLMDQSLRNALERSKTSDTDRVRILLWARTQGIEELPDSIDFEITKPFLTATVDNEPNEARSRELAPIALIASYPWMFKHIIAWNTQRDRDVLQTLTCEATSPSKAPYRL